MKINTLILSAFALATTYNTINFFLLHNPKQPHNNSIQLPHNKTQSTPQLTDEFPEELLQNPHPQPTKNLFSEKELQWLKNNNMNFAINAHPNLQLQLKEFIRNAILEDSLMSLLEDSIKKLEPKPKFKP